MQRENPGAYTHLQWGGGQLPRGGRALGHKVSNFFSKSSKEIKSKFKSDFLNSLLGSKVGDPEAGKNTWLTSYESGDPLCRAVRTEQEQRMRLTSSLITGVSRGPRTRRIFLNVILALFVLKFAQEGPRVFGEPLQSCVLHDQVSSSHIQRPNTPLGSFEPHLASESFLSIQALLLMASIVF